MRVLVKFLWYHAIAYLDDLDFVVEDSRVQARLYYARFVERTLQQAGLTRHQGPVCRTFTKPPRSPIPGTSFSDSGTRLPQWALTTANIKNFFGHGTERCVRLVATPKQTWPVTPLTSKTLVGGEGTGVDLY